jgi:hypothetical protein
MQRIILMLVAAALVTGCGGAKLKSYVPENRESDLGAVLDRLGTAGKQEGKEGRSIIAVVLEDGHSLSLTDLDTGKKLWERKGIVVSSAPTIGPAGVYFRSEGKIMALSIDSGHTLWKKSIKESYLYGFAFDGGKMFVTTGNTNGGSPATGRLGVIMALDPGSGGTSWTVQAEKMLGAPAAAAGLVFVPWDRQAISVFDGQKGQEICRLIRKDSTVDFILAGPGGVFYGSAKDIQKLTKESLGGMKTEKSTFEFEIKDMPGSPRIFPDSYMESSYQGGANTRNRLLWSMGEPGDEIKLNQDMIYFVYYRYVIGFDAVKKLPVWVHMSGAQIANSETAGSGLLLIGMDGALTYVDGKTGTTKTIWKEDFSPENAFLGTAGFADPQIEKGEPDLHRGLVDMILDVDTQVLPLRKYGMKLLALIPDEKVTLDLVQVMSSSELPKALRDEAARLLRGRKGGVKYLLEALKLHEDFLEEQTAPPSGAIASSLVESAEKSAAPLLVEHLKDHETPAEELAELSAAILQLGDKKAYEPLKKFLLMYHADSSMSQHVDALVNIARGVIKFGGEEGRAVVEAVAGDPHSPESLRFQLADVLKEKPGEEKGAEGEKEGPKHGKKGPGPGKEGDKPEKKGHKPGKPVETGGKAKPASEVKGD